MHIKGRIKFSHGQNRKESVRHTISFTKLEFICKDLIYARPLRLPYIVALRVFNLRLDSTDYPVKID